MLVNYWWRQSPAYMDSPISALMLALMTIRDLPPEQRAAWQDLFRHYVFEPGDDTAAHIPAARGARSAPLDANLARELRANVLKRLNDRGRMQNLSQSQDRVRRVVIAGGGTAGWMVAACLSKTLGKLLDITLVESDEIGTVGVGEATIPTLVTFHRLLEINEQEFMAATQATFKLGICFENWRDVGENYIHSFGTTGKDHWTAGFQHFWLKGRARRLATDYGDYCLELRASLESRFAHLPRDGMNYAFHMDAGLYAQFLRHFSEGLRRAAHRRQDRRGEDWMRRRATSPRISSTPATCSKATCSSTARGFAAC